MVDLRCAKQGVAPLSAVAVRIALEKLRADFPGFAEEEERNGGREKGGGE